MRVRLDGRARGTMSAPGVTVWSPYLIGALMRVRIHPLPLTRLRAVRGLVALGAVGALVLGMLAAFAGPSASARVADPGKAPAAGGERRAATDALREAQEIRTDGAAGRDATMALRDLFATRDALTGAEREAADRILARPTSPGGDGYLNYGNVDEAPPVCNATLCVHYVTEGANASTPAQVNETLTTLTDVHNNFIASGYRAPKADGNRGGNSKIDVYLGNIGNLGIYGYCTSDDPNKSTSRYDRWAYCALDNDFSAEEFPTNTPLENRQVTAAHEYFHAIQFAYDAYEDAWLMEATAAWVEDELYDNVDDNLQYLRTSQMRNPGIPLDTFNPSTGFHYGTWSFFRFLTEKYRGKKGVLPKLVLDIWKKADSTPGAPDMYSWQAVNAVLKKKKTTGAAMLGAYAVANRRPAKAYDEGRANKYPTAPAKRIKLAKGKTRGHQATLNHLTTRTVVVQPKGKMGKKAKVRLKFNLSRKATGAYALVTTTAKSGKVRTVRVKLNRQGDGVRVVPFNNKVKKLEVTLVNGSGRFKCWQRTGFSCQGTPLDNRLVQRFTATALRR